MATTISTTASDKTSKPMADTDNASNPFSTDGSTARKLFEDELDLGADTEWTMLIKLASGDNDAEVNIVEIHRTILTLMQQSDPTVGFKTIGGREIGKTADFPTGYQYKQSFRIKESRNQFLVAHPVRSNKSLDEIKRHNQDLLAYLKVQNVYIDLSVTGSLVEVVLGPWFGVHPDFTSKRRFKQDLIKLICCHTEWGSHQTELLRKAKETLDFPGILPSFQLRTRRIRR
jgi:hypothetical protein